MRITKHRQEILDEIDKNEDTVSAAEIHAALPHINLVTIYRNLEYFVASNLIKKLNFGEQEARYEIHDEPHHHAICDTCKKIIHFTTDDVELIKEFYLPNFKIKSLEVTLHGSCNKHNKNFLK